jgi:type IV secretory pathway VirB2 component (pilin)
MPQVTQALQNVITLLQSISGLILIIALIIAGLNMASADSGRHEKAKRQMIGIAIAAIVIFGATFIVNQLISLIGR